MTCHACDGERSVALGVGPSTDRFDCPVCVGLDLGSLPSLFRRDAAALVAPLPRAVDQTTFGHPGGNCFSACVASLLDLPIEEVPYFMDADPWELKFNAWLAPRGFYSATFACVSSWRPPGLYILGGQSSRGSHAVVARDREIIHDPHPSREGLRDSEDITVLVPFAPVTRPR